MFVQVSNAVALMDPVTMRVTHLDSKAYWNSPFGSFLNSRMMVKYVVLDCEIVDGNQHGKWQLADVQVRASTEAIQLCFIGGVISIVASSCVTRVTL